MVEQLIKLEDADDREMLRKWLRSILDHTGWSGAELARRIGRHPSTINRFLSDPDASTLGFRTVRKIEKVAAAKLGNMAVLAELTSADGERSPSLNDGTPALARGAALHKTTIVEVDGSEFASIPRYDAALSAGAGSIIDPEAEPIGHHLIEAQWLRSVTQSSPARLAVLRVAGDSMEETLHAGDWVLVDRAQRRASDEGIYALQVGESTWVKRLTLNLRERLIRIISDNPRYPVQELSQDELEVIGKIVCIVARKV